MLRSAVLAVTERQLTNKVVTETTVGRRVAKRFVAGEELAEAIAVAVALNQAGMVVSLDHLGEHVSEIGEAERATLSYLECLDAISDSGVEANISVKLSQLGMGMDDDVAAANLERLASAAEQVGTTITVDMEESAVTDTTIDIFERSQLIHGNLGIAIQAYLHRTPADLDRLMPVAHHIRLCKGAYAEPEDIAYQSRSDVNDAFDRLATTLMHGTGAKPAIASHDDGRLQPVLTMATSRTEPWEFQFLYGIRRDRQAELAEAGHEVRIYVPYGEAWYPYLTRRMAERPANLTFLARALVGR